MLSGTVENPYSIWTIGDATFDRMAGIDWANKEFLSSIRTRFLRMSIMVKTRIQNRRNRTREISLDSRAPGDIWDGNQITILGSGNQNAFSRLDSRSAKRGLAIRMVATVRFRCIKNRIEVYHSCLRILHIAIPDFVTRESEHEIQQWATHAGFKQLGKRWRWKQFLERASKLD